jgi:VIT1/CCC1 family predicted Fe2+/Mn2+ transporter
MTPDQFALNEYRDYITYRELAKTETVPAFKKILEALVEREIEDYRFWLPYCTKKAHRISGCEVWCLKAMRMLLGLTFTAKFLEGNERQAVRNYTAFLKDADETMRAKVEDILHHERAHEQELIGQIQEERVSFLSSIVLGVNDGLIELTGALVGFAFALHHHMLVALLGTVTGIAASLSMAASAYMQARHEAGKEPKKAGLYTGGAYLLVVVLLVVPYFLISNLSLAMGVMFGLILLLILGLSFYSSVLFARDFKRQAGEMLLFSLGVAGITFLLGSLVRSMIGQVALGR